MSILQHLRTDAERQAYLESLERTIAADAGYKAPHHVSFRTIAARQGRGRRPISGAIAPKATKTGSARSVEHKATKFVTMYNPPNGEQFGFPKVYNPRDTEALCKTLIRDGYPEDDAYTANAQNTIFFDKELS